ncbi:RNA-binding protein [cyanobacterium endosymbiont of Rhopalodia gibberula]|uniref:RNA recognition motif domain-containing protein n=1 Tax=cyanobacterium endosymbiont of Rhopalodia gibberula TaxID=1763363 RepID=UPI000DC72B78|nr:RNA-binding protein [cyanobacterium endosymbiont of Rhopalodia gibberula]BBA78993.1 RNA-binding protein [cyanobacterium endosymbiont of Rhopalodia gibberula]
MPIRLYVGNLPKEPIERQALQEMFADAGEIMSTKVIKDRKTGKCRGFAFVTVATDELADAFIEKYNGQPFMDSSLKIEKALPRAKNIGKEEKQEEKFTQTSAPAPKSLAKKGGAKKRSRAQGSGSSPSGDSFQPDPRWADELAKLKEMLATSSN